MEITHKDIKSAIIKSQHCQRNWNLEKAVPKDDLDLLIHAVTNCPSKQNVSYYNVYVIQDRNIINQIHSQTNGFVVNDSGDTTTNSQVLANLLFAFVEKDFENVEVDKNKHINTQLENLIQNAITKEDLENLKRDRQTAIGIASGYLNLTASILGYSTGCCMCFDPYKIKEIIGADGPVSLLMGVGHKDENRNRRLHHETDYMFPTKTKQPINVVIK